MVGNGIVSTSEEKSHVVNYPPAKPIVPGFSNRSKENKPTDINLTSFMNSDSKTYQYGDTSLTSIHTDDPRWLPGECWNLSKYEGRFRKLISSQSHPDPKRTRKAKIRKIVAKKKEKSYKMRKEMQNKRELNKFKETKKSTISSWDTLYDSILVPSTFGLKGGVSPKKAKLKDYPSVGELQLINRGSDCFVNSIIQLLRNTEYFKFIQEHFPSLSKNCSPDSYKLSQLLSKIYQGQHCCSNVR